MIFATPQPFATDYFFPPAEYRPLGSEAAELQKSIEKIFEPVIVPESERREFEIRHLLLTAAQQAVESEGIFVSPSAFRNARQFMESLPSELVLPAVVVEANDKIGLDWDEGPERVVSLTIYNSDHIGFSALLGSRAHYGRVDYVHELPQRLPDKIQSLLEHAHPSAFD